MFPDLIVREVFDMFSVFCYDDLGMVVTCVCVMGACVALFRILRRGAGG